MSERTELLEVAKQRKESFPEDAEFLDRLIDYLSHIRFKFEPCENHSDRLDLVESIVITQIGACVIPSTGQVSHMEFSGSGYVRNSEA